MSKRALSVALLAAACAHPAAPSAPPMVAVPSEVTPLPQPGRPPAVRGGGLLVTTDGRRALTTDPDRDAVVVTDLTSRGLPPVAHVVFDRGAAPGRMAEDSAGRVHVVLRGAGAVATIDPARGERVATRTVCPSPRGVAWDAAAGQVLVACAGGEVRALDARDVRTVARFEPDLRDVVLDGAGNAFVSRFRSAELIALGSGHRTGIGAARLPGPRRYGEGSLRPFEARVAWRTVSGRSGDVWVLHQRHLASEVQEPFHHYYGGFTNPTVVKPALTRFENGQMGESIVLDGGPLAVDVAEAPGTGTLAIAYGAEPIVETFHPVGTEEHRRIVLANGRAVGVGWVGDLLLVQQRAPSGLTLVDPGTGAVLAVTVFGEPFASNDGHDLFHERTETGVACASCHPEGGDDGHVWNFAGRTRRTPSLRGGVMATAPFHWNGEHTELADLMSAVFVQRMGGHALTRVDVGMLGDWLDDVPAPRFAAPEAGDVARGRELFESTSVGCASCHTGAFFTDNRNYDVGTGGFFQTPSLVGLRDRAPYFHDGRAPSIASRFGRHHTEGHGNLAGSSAADLRDLIAYVSTL